MLGFFWWLIIGLVAGGLARLLIPGEQRMSIIMTMILGLVGSVIGGLISTFIFGYNAADPGFHVGGLIMSTVGAILVLVAYSAYAQRKIA